jgi:geranylgeranyl pyrophosphate synthase
MLSNVRLEDGRRLSETEARDVVDAVRGGDATQRALAQAHQHAQNAREKLRSIDSSDATSALASLTDYVVTRKL